MKPSIGLVLATALIVAAVFPWGDFQGHTHWSKVAWIPFVSKPVRIRDIVANLLLFMPFGLALSRATGESRVWIVVFSAVILSLVGETLQLYSHTRFPSATDVVCNAVGAGMGAVARRRWSKAVPPTKVTSGGG